MKQVLNKYIKNLSIKNISDYLINIGILLCVINLILLYISRSRLPEGVCPINENNSLILLSIVISSIGLVLSFFNKDKK